MIASTSISSSVTPRYSILRRGIDFEVLELRLGVVAAVGLDEADDDVEPARPQRVGLLQHRVGLADAGRGADVDAQARPVLLLEARQQRVSASGRCSGIGPSAAHVPTPGPTATSTTSIALMPTNGSDHAAEAVDQHVAPQNRRRAERLVGDALAAPAESAR